MNALIFLVPEDIVDIRPRLVSLRCLSSGSISLTRELDSHLRRKLDERRTINLRTNAYLY